MFNTFLSTILFVSVFSLPENGHATSVACFYSSTEKSAGEVISETAKIVSEVKLLVEKALAGKNQKEYIEPLHTAEKMLEKVADSTEMLYEEFSAKRKSLTVESPLYQGAADLEAGFYELTNDLQELLLKIHHANNTDSYEEFNRQLKKTEKLFPEIENILNEIRLQLLEQN